MKTQERKERDYNRREHELLDVAEELYKSGESNVTMDNLAEKSGHSKGTIYKHFTSKEDLIAALGAKYTRVLRNLFSKAVKYSGNSRERQLAIYLAYGMFNRTNPSGFAMIVAAKSRFVKEKISTMRQSQYEELDNSIRALAMQLIEKAVQSGDLKLDDDLSPYAFAVINWGLAHGVTSLIDEIQVDQKFAKIVDSEETLLIAAHKLLDGFGWAPLSHEFDYNQSVKQIREFLKDVL